jgi:hypothetical protein
MQVTVNIDKCVQCRHLDHSGAFTPGGAQWICGHSDSVPSRKSVGDDNYHWKHRVLNPGDPTHMPDKIPNWCPLKRGAKY